MEVKKIVNFRVIFYLFILGMFCVYISYKMFLDFTYSLALIVPTLFLFFILIKRRYILFVFSILYFTFLVIYPFSFISSYADYALNNKGNVYVTGKVFNINQISSTFCFITIEDVTAIDANGEIHHLLGKTSLSVKVDNKIKFSPYDRISFKSNISNVDLLEEDNQINTFYLRYDIRYTINVNASDLQFVSSDKTIIESFREYNRQLLVKGFGEVLGNVAFTSLYGDTNYTDRDLLAEFKYSGVAHIFSVSGLHISLIVLIINFILQKLNTNRKIRLIITGFILFLFCMLCNFNSPVIRSSIMSMVLVLSSTVFRKYDGLNSIGLAGVILLLINPMNTFDVGFQMTFLSILGIIMFSNVVKKIKIKNQFFNALFLSCVTSIGAQLALLPILANVYGYVSTWSLIANLIIIPMFSLFYTTLFLINLVILPLPFLNFLYFAPKVVLEAIFICNRLVTSLPYSIFVMPKISDELIFIFYINLFIISKYVMIDFKIKILVTILVFTLLIGTIYFENKGKNTVYFTNQNYFEQTEIYNNYNYKCNQLIIYNSKYQ